MKRSTVLLALLLFVLTSSALGTVSASIQGGEEYVVQPDDWLSKIATRFYADSSAWPAIWQATNAMAAQDSSFDIIADPHLILVGQKLWIPDGADVEDILADLEETSKAERVVILSIDGARDDWVDDYLADGIMPNLASVGQRGAAAEYAQTIDPSLTAAAHVSIATGAYPAKTGQVSNRFHLSKNAFYWYTSGFDEPEMQVEPLWRTAMRNGLTTATLFWPGTTIDIEDRLADYTVAYGAREVYSKAHFLTPTKATEWHDAPTSHSSLIEATVRITGKDDALVSRVYLLAADSTDDEQENYDTCLLCRKKQVDADCAALGVGEWAPLVVRPRLQSGAYFRLGSVSAERIELFQSALYYNRAHPAELLRDINERFGFFRPSPDYHALEHGWITAQDYWEMAETQTRWMVEVATYVFSAYEPDLTFAWLGVTDECGHQFLMVDERQLHYSEERAQEYELHRHNAYALADECLGDWVGTLDLEKDAIIVLSDHGMAPIHSQVYVNTILEQAGLLQYGEGSSYPVDTAHSRAVAFASGGAVHVYINLKGREQPGIVPEDEYEAVQDEIVAALRGAAAIDGMPLFARVVRREELAELGLDSPVSGDVFAQASLGYALTDWRGNPRVVEPATYYGQHGYDSTLLEMRAILYAAGCGIKAGVKLPAVHLLDVVPTAARLLRVAPAETIDGHILEEMLR